jgi:hypothetical protein
VTKGAVTPLLRIWPRRDKPYFMTIIIFLYPSIFQLTSDGKFNIIDSMNDSNLKCQNGIARFAGKQYGSRNKMKCSSV